MSSGVRLEIGADFTPFDSHYIHTRRPQRFSQDPDGQKRFRRWAEGAIREGVRLIKRGVSSGEELRQLFERVCQYVAEERALHAKENGTPNAEAFGVRRAKPIKGVIFHTLLGGVYTEHGTQFATNIASQCQGLQLGRTVTITDRDPQHLSTISIELLPLEDYLSRYPLATLEQLELYIPEELIHRVLNESNSKQLKQLAPEEIVTLLMSNRDCIEFVPSAVYRSHFAAHRLGMFIEATKQATPSDQLVVVTKNISKAGLFSPLADYIGIWEPEADKMSLPMIFHTDEVDIECVDRILAQLFSEILRWHRGLSLDLLIEKVAFFRYIQGNAGIDGRGSATTAEIRELMLYRFHGIDAQNGPFDLLAIVKLTHSPFLVEYKRNLKLRVDVPLTIHLTPEYTFPTDGQLSSIELEEGFKQVAQLANPTLASTWSIFGSLTKTRLRTRALSEQLSPPDPATLVSNIRRLIPDLKKETYKTTAHGHEQALKVKKVSQTDPGYASISKYFTKEALEKGSLLSITKEASIDGQSYTLSQSYVCLPKEPSDFPNAMGLIEYTRPEAIQPIMDALEVHFQKALSWDPSTPIRNLRGEVATILYFLSHAAPNESPLMLKWIEHAMYRFHNMDCPTDDTVRHALSSPNTETFYPDYRDQWK